MDEFDEEVFREQLFRELFPERHRVVEAARRLADSVDPTHYMHMSPRRGCGGIPDGLVIKINEAGEARSELCEAVGAVPRFEAVGG